MKIVWVGLVCLVTGLAIVSAKHSEAVTPTVAAPSNWYSAPMTITFSSMGVSTNDEPLLVFHPDGTVTGTTHIKPDEAARQILDMLKATAPDYFAQNCKGASHGP